MIMNSAAAHILILAPIESQLMSCKLSFFNRTEVSN